MMLKEKSRILLAFTIIAFLAYRNCFDIFIPGDNYSLFYLFDQEGITGSIKNLGPYFVTMPFIFLLYKFIGIAAQGWIGTSLVLHILNAFLVYLFTKQITNAFIKIQVSSIAFFAGVIFLISPYQTEAILWTPTDMVILISTSLSLGCMLLLLKYFESLEKFPLYSFHIAFFLAMFSYESSCIVPGISLFLYILYKNKTTLSLKNFTQNVLLPQVGIVLSYLVITKLIFNHWLWHSGNFEVSTSAFWLVKTGLKYLARFFLFYRYLPLNNFDDFVRSILNNYYLCGLIFILVSASFIYLFKRLLKNNKGIGLVSIGIFSCFITSLLPVLSLDSSFLSYIYPDRYGYMPSVFFYIFLVLTLFYILKKFAVPLLITYCILCWILLMKTNSVWNSANKYYTQIIENYKPFLEFDKVYILNVPAYYAGVAAFRCAFAETIYMKYNRSPVDKIRVISGVYQESSQDSLSSIVWKNNTINVSGLHKKTPCFSTDGGWPKPYETSEYYVKYDSTGGSYTLVFKQEIPKNSAFIYLVNGVWKKVN